MATYFIADLHLTPERESQMVGGDRAPAVTTERFLRFLDRIAADGNALYILGDLFDAWIGDDAAQPAYGRIVDALNRLSLPIYLLHGNRDFLLDQQFCRATSAQLLEDPTTIEVMGATVLISHGDLFCTDDVEYQQVRAVVREPQWRSRFLNQPIEERIRQAQQFREQSKIETANKSVAIMDVNERSITSTLNAHAVTTLIHGHTHRPARHEHAVTSGTAIRWVLGSWQEQGEILRWDQHGPELIAIDEFLTRQR